MSCGDCQITRQQLRASTIGLDRNGLACVRPAFRLWYESRLNKYAELDRMYYSEAIKDLKNALCVLSSTVKSSMVLWLLWRFYGFGPTSFYEPYLKTGFLLMLLSILCRPFVLPAHRVSVVIKY